jgi:hypothetical protein
MFCTLDSYSCISKPDNYLLGRWLPWYPQFMYIANGKDMANRVCSRLSSPNLCSHGARVPSMRNAYGVIRSNTLVVEYSDKTARLQCPLQVGNSSTAATLPARSVLVSSRHQSTDVKRSIFLSFITSFSSNLPAQWWFGAILSPCKSASRHVLFVLMMVLEHVTPRTSQRGRFPGSS